MKQVLLCTVASILLTFTSFAQLNTTISATGLSSGEVATATVENTGRQTQAVTLPSGIIPGRSAHQGFLVPKPVPVRVPGGQTVTVPITGYCMDFSLPTPAPGTQLPPPSEWDTGSPIVPQVTSILDALNEGNDVPSTPFRIDADMIAQEIIWVLTSPSDHSLNDLCTRIRQGFASHAGSSLNSGQQQQLDHAISEVLGLVCRTLRENCPISQAHIPDLPGISTAASSGTSKPPPKPTGTGRTTGHICTVEFTNPGDNPVKVQIGPPGSALYIPAHGKHQPYVVPSVPAVTVPAGATVQIPVMGYCTDVRRPPVADGAPMPPLSEWISAAGGSAVPEGNDVLYFPTRTAPPMSTVADAVQNAALAASCLPSACQTAQRDCPDVLPAGLPLLPGTNNKPLPFPVNEETHPSLAVPILLEAIGDIIQAYETLQPKGAINTPFSGRPAEEREAVIQQTFWIYSAAMNGNTYTQDDFRQRTTEQFENNTGRKLDESPQEMQEQVEKGVQDFWNSFQATGAEAKVLPKVPQAPAVIAPGVADYLSGKPKPAPNPKLRSQPDATTSMPLNVLDDIPFQPDLLSVKNVSNCKCDKLVASMLIYNTVPTETGGWRGDGDPHFTNAINTPIDGTPLELDARNDERNASRQMIILRNIRPSCNCETKYSSSQLDSELKAARRELKRAEEDIGRDTTRAAGEVAKAQRSLNRAKGEKSIDSAQGKLTVAQTKLAKARNQVIEARKRLEALENTEADVPQLNPDACPAEKPTITAKVNGQAIKLENEWFGGADDAQHPGHNFRLSQEPGTKLEIELTITYICTDTDCGKAASCSKTIKVIVHKP